MHENSRMMGRNEGLTLPESAYLISAQCIADERGRLCIAENAELPFNIERVFWITDVPAAKTRGGHAHRICAEIIFPLQGSFSIYVHDGDGERTYAMNASDRGIYIGPNVWCELRDFAPGTVCMVLASHRYIAEGYINDYNEFLSR